MRITRRHALAAGGAAIASLAALGRSFAATHRRPSQARSSSLIEVRAKRGAITGTVSFGGKRYPCMVGKSGIVQPKYEGDGGTPEGMYPLREVRYRADRMSAPKTGLPVFKATPSDGWCDDPEDPAYNRIVHMPYQTDAEPMWRDDHVYDVLAVIGYNDAPTVPGAGSAIFMHVMRPPTDDHQYTAGCVSLVRDDLLAVLGSCTASTVIDIRAL